MADVLDLAALLAPLADNDGAGADLREDFSPASPYQKLRDARSAARTEERARDAEGEAGGPPPEGWRVVRGVAEEAIANRSKDFELASWLVEALVRLDGLRGLTAGAQLLDGLLEQYWEQGFPRPDEDGMGGRAAPIGGLAGGEADGTLMQSLRRSPVFRRADGSMLGLYQYEAALEVAGFADQVRKEARYAAGVPKLDQIEAEARLDIARLRGTAAAARTAAEAWAAMTARLDERFGSDAPTSRRVAEVLDRLREVAEKLAGGPEAAEAVPGEAAAEGAAPASAGGGGGGLGGAIASREEALRQLERIAAFFKQTEPHSPLAYTLQDAARRGRLTLPELLAEVLSDESSRTAMLTALGIRPPQPDE